MVWHALDLSSSLYTSPLTRWRTKPCSGNLRISDRTLKVGVCNTVHAFPCKAAAAANTTQAPWRQPHQSTNRISPGAPVTRKICQTEGGGWMPGVSMTGFTITRETCLRVGYGDVSRRFNWWGKSHGKCSQPCSWLGVPDWIQREGCSWAPASPWFLTTGQWGQLPLDPAPYLPQMMNCAPPNCELKQTFFSLCCFCFVLSEGQEE